MMTMMTMHCNGDDDDDNDDDELSVPRPLLGDDQTFGSNIDTLHCTAESALNSTAMNWNVMFSLPMYPS